MKLWGQQTGLGNLSLRSITGTPGQAALGPLVAQGPTSQTGAPEFAATRSNRAKPSKMCSGLFRLWQPCYAEPSMRRVCSSSG